MPPRVHDSTSFGVVLRRLRRAAGLSQQELAERAGLSLRGIADLERGARRNPYPVTVRRLVQALELNNADRAALLAGAAAYDSIAGSRHPELANSLPPRLSSFIGREREKAAIKKLMETSRLVTLTGTGGIGKTRLALEAVADAEAVAFVDLAPVTDGQLVAAAIAQALGIRKQPSMPLETLLTKWLVSRPLLLLLDNCEHQLQSCARLAEVLLSTCPGLRVLATSRERLAIPGEMSWRVPSLAIPEADASTSRVLECEAVHLFVERAMAVSSDFSLTPHNAASIATLVRRLDGIPLAIELAAARVSVLAVEQIANRLDGAVQLLIAGSRIAPARQQTLRATFEWSHGLLSDPERLLFARLSVFAGGWTLTAAEQVCGDGASEKRLAAPHLDRASILDLLSQLIDKSLVLSEPGNADELRYRLLEPVRQFAATCLEHQGATAVLRLRHARWVTELVSRSAAQFHGPHETAALERLEREHANIQAAFDWLLIQPSQRYEAVRLAHGLWWFWAARDHWSEAITRLTRLLHGQHLDTVEESELDLLWMAGSIAWMSGDFKLANGWTDQCVAAARQHNQAGVLARVLGIAAQLAAARGDYVTARQLSDEGLPLVRQTGPRWSEARYLDAVALIAIEQGDFDEATKWLTGSLEVARAMGDAWSQAAALNKLGDVARGQGDYKRAGRLYEESLLRLEGQGDELRASVLHNLGYVSIASGDQPRAATLFAQSLKICQARGDQRGVAECLVGLACLAAATGQHERAGLLFGAADAAFEDLGTELSPSNRTERALGLDLARGAGEHVFANGFAAGQALPLDEAVRKALSTGASMFAY